MASDCGNVNLGNLTGHNDHIPDLAFYEQCCDRNCNFIYNMSNNEYSNYCENNYLHVSWDDAVSSNTCMETPHLIFTPVHDTNWHVVDIMDTYLYEILDKSDNYYMYVHNNHLHTSFWGVLYSESLQVK